MTTGENQNHLRKQYCSAEFGSKKYTVQTLEQPLMLLLFSPETEEVCW